MGIVRLLLLLLLLPAVALPAAAVPAADDPGSMAGGPEATPAPPTPPITELVALAREHSPTLAALRAEVAAMRHRELPAAALPDPLLEAVLEGFHLARNTAGSNEKPLTTVELRQGIPYPGKRAARRRAAEAETAWKAAELVQMESAVERQVRVLYARLYALDSEATSLAAAHELLDVLTATAQTRYATGQAEQEALLKAQLEVSRLAERRTDLAAERAGQLAMLNRLLDRPGAEPLGRVAEIAAVPAPERWQELATVRSPMVAEERATVVVAERRLALARLDLKPDLSAGAELGVRGSLDPIVTLRFGVELPVYRRQKQIPLAAAAEEGLTAARARVAEAEAATRASAATLAARLAAAEAQIVLYREAILPQSSAAVDAARAAYLAGRGDFTTAIQDFQLWLEARLQLARREADRASALAEIHELTSVQTVASSLPSPLGEGSGVRRFANLPGGTQP